MRPCVYHSNIFDITRQDLGAGSFSIVKLGYIKGDKVPIAVKICHCNSVSEWLHSLNEICFLKKLANTNILRMINYEITKSHVLIGVEKGQGTLKHFIADKDIFKLRSFAFSILIQLMNGLNFIHSFHIIHGDIKPNNIIYNMNKANVEIQIMDFGLSHVSSRMDLTTPVSAAGGTTHYLAPERLLNQRYDEKSDLFSVGIIFFELLFKRHPFFKEGVNYAESMKKKPDPDFPNEEQYKAPRQYMEILCSLLSYNPNNRAEVRTSPVLGTYFPIDVAQDHQVLAVQAVELAEEHEKHCRYSEAAILYIQACMDLRIACHEADVGQEFIVNIDARISTYKKKIEHLLHVYRYSYSQEDACGSTNIHDEFYDYLMKVCSATPTLKNYIDLGYMGEMLLRDNKKKLAFKKFMDALKSLNNMIKFEPPGDRKTIIGKKMQQWTSLAESLKEEVQ